MKLEYLQAAQLPEYRAIGTRFFPDADWDAGIRMYSDILLRYPQAIAVVRDPRRIIHGYLVLLPLTLAAFAEYAAGTRTDEALTLECVATRVPDRDARWLLRAIAVAGDDRATRAEVIKALLSSYDDRVLSAVPSRVVAHASTSDGVRFLTRCGFELTGRTYPYLATRSYP